MSTTSGNRSKPLNGNGAWAAYVVNKQARNRYSFTIDCEGECYWMVEGTRVTETEFNQMFPIGLINRSTHDHLDSRQKIY
jgi:hypothetical protein